MRRLLPCHCGGESEQHAHGAVAGSSGRDTFLKRPPWPLTDVLQSASASTEPSAQSCIQPIKVFEHRVRALASRSLPSAHNLDPHQKAFPIGGSAKRPAHLQVRICWFHLQVPVRKPDLDATQLASTLVNRNAVDRGSHPLCTANRHRLRCGTAAVAQLVEESTSHPIPNRH